MRRALFSCVRNKFLPTMTLKQEYQVVKWLGCAVSIFIIDADNNDNNERCGDWFVYLRWLVLTLYLLFLLLEM